MENENKQKGKVGLIIIIILLILCIGMGVFIFINKDKLFTTNMTTNTEEVKSNNTKDVSKNDFNISYKDEEYNINGSKGGTFNNKRNIVTITSSNYSDSASKIQNNVNSISDKYWNEIKKETDELKDETNYTGLGANFIISTGVIRDNSISFKFTEDGTFGGVNWNNEIVTNYNIKTGEVLSLSDISSNGLKDYLVNEIINKLENDSNYKNDLMNDYKTTISNVIDNSWIFTDDGISVVFEKYSVADGAAGIITIDFTKDQVNSYLNDDYKF